MMTHIFPKKPRRALTLLELLIVVGVVSVLAAIVLPAIKNVLTDQKNVKTALIVRNFIQAAQARAVGTNRKVAVVLQRLSSRPADLNQDGIINALDVANGSFYSSTAQSFDVSDRALQPYDLNYIPYNACIQLSLAEERAPMTHLQMPLPPGARTRFACRSEFDALETSGVIPIPTNVYSGTNSLVASPPTENRIFYVSITQPDSKFGELEASGTELQYLADYLVAGNEVQFSGSSRRFVITAPINRTPHDTMLAQPDSAGVRRIWFSINNRVGPNVDGTTDGLALCPSYDFNVPTDVPPALPPGNPPPSRRPVLPSKGFFHEFQVHPSPTPVIGQSIRLPRGMCIDLSLSGFGTKGNSLNDSRTQFASDWVMNGRNPRLKVTHPNELRPIYLVFSPDGHYTSSYSNRFESSSIMRRDTVDDVYLHIGKIDQIVNTHENGVRTTAGLLDAISKGLKTNLTDLSAFVIRLSRGSSTTTAAPALSFQTQLELIARDRNTTPQAVLSELSFGDIVELTRRGTFSSNVSSQ
jgi:prepilin-type N-terminal cleavage/methylation domain-containing protein